MAGDVIRRLVVAQQMAKATAPHQYALSTRAGCECLAHVLEGLTLDGIGAFDTISREAMLRGLRQADDTTFQFVSMFYGSPRSTCGKTTRARSTESRREKVARKGCVNAALVRTRST